MRAHWEAIAVTEPGVTVERVGGNYYATVQWARGGHSPFGGRVPSEHHSTVRARAERAAREAGLTVLAYVGEVHGRGGDRFKRFSLVDVEVPR